MRLTRIAAFLIALAPWVVTGQAPAATDVQITENHAELVAQIGTSNFQVKVGSDLNFSDTATVSGGGASATATQDTTTVDSPGGILLDSDATTSASGSLPPASCTGQPFPEGCTRAHAGLSRDLTVTQPVAWRVSATISGSDFVTGRVRLRLVGPEEAFDVDTDGPFADEGVIQPGDYQFFAEADSTVCVSPCDTSWQVHLELGSPAPAVAIGSGPSGVVASNTAQFDFTTTDPSPPPGEFQCRIDGQATFTTCTSPVSLASLSDGLHTFRVRYDPTGPDPPSAPTVRTWTVDTTAPSVVFDSAPSGSNNGSSAQIAFHSTEPSGATFRCRVDGGAEFDCSSPHSLVNLAPGPHSFSVTTTDAVGNASVAATAAWTVSAPATPPVVVSCPPGGDSAGFGPVRLVARASNACFVDETVGGVAARVSRGQVTLNGITLTPAPGSRIVVSRSLGNGTVRVEGPVTIVFGPPPGPGGSPISLTLPRLDLPSLGTTATIATKSLTFGNNALSDVAGLKALPSVALELTPDNGGQVKTTFSLALPKIAFKRLPGRDPAIEGVTVEFSPTFSNDRGVTFGGRIKLGQTFLFGQKIKDLDLAYDHGTGVFEGSFGVEFGRPRFGVDPTLTGSIGIAPTASQCGLRKVGLAASNLNKHIGDGVFLQRYGGDLQCALENGNQVVKLNATAGVSVGPRVRIPPFGEVEALSIDGTATLAIPTGPQPPELFSFSVGGVGKIVDIPVSEQTVTYKPPASVFLSGKLDFTIGGYGAELTYGPQGSFVSEGLFNIEATGAVDLFGIQLAAEAVYSTIGFAVCFGPPSQRVGFGKAWLGGSLTAFSSTCDVGPFRVTPSRAAQSGARPFTVGPDRPLTVLAAEGADAPPKLVLTGPGGRRIETPAGPGSVSNRDVLLVQDPGAKTTFVALFRPAAGAWSVSTADGSPALKRLRFARGLPPLKVAARVTGRGARRVLRWKAKGLAGQRLSFVERAGGAGRLLKTTRRASGSLRFTPDPVFGTRRTIEAIAFNGPTPRSTTTAARYRVAAPATPKRVSGLRLRRGLLTWKAQRAATSYEVALLRPDGTTSSHTVRRARLKVSGLPRKGTLRVSIVAVNARGRTGKVVKAKLKLS